MDILIKMIENKIYQSFKYSSDIKIDN